MPEAARPARPARSQHVFIVQRTEQVSPHLVRVHLGGPAFAAFIAEADPERLAATDKYVKLLMARRGAGLTPPYDLEALRETVPAADLPVRRTYTVRSIDTAAETIAIDFVVHGDEGIAGPWAAAATPGDLLALSGPGGMYSPANDASTRLLLFGDDSAVPAIAAAVEAMRPDAVGTVLIEVDGPDDELDLGAPAGVEVRWIHRTDTRIPATPGEPLVEAVRQLPLPDPDVAPPQVFAHGERTAMKQLRAILQDDWGVDRRDLSLSAYWALGRAEDAFQAEKREPVGQIFGD